VSSFLRRPTLCCNAYSTDVHNTAMFWHLTTWPFIKFYFSYIYIYIYIYIYRKSRDSSVDIALDYGPDDRGSRVRFPARAGNFSLHHRVQNGSGAHPASYPMGIRGSFPAGKAAGAWSWHSPHLVPRSKNEWSYTSTPQYAFLAWCSVKKSTGQLYLYLYLYLMYVHIYTHT
jgi:hypothetical protein